MKIGSASRTSRSSAPPSSLVPTALAIGQRAGRARHHAFAAGDAGRVAHRQIVVEGNARLISLAASRQHPVVPNLIAAADAAIAEDAGFVIDRDGQGGIVVSARRAAPGKARLLDPGLRGQTLQFAVAGMLLPRAGRGMVGHQQFQQSPANAQHRLGVRLHRHPGFGLTNAGGGIDSLAHVHDANAAYAHRIFILLVTQGGNRNAVDAGGVENGGALRDGHRRAVDRQLICDVSVCRRDS